MPSNLEDVAVELRRQLGLFTGVFVIVADMIGTGIAVILPSSVTAQMMVGPRVSYAMAKDGLIFQSPAKVHLRFETPHAAILVQMILTVLYVFTGSALTLVIYLGFALSLFPLLAVVVLLGIPVFPVRERIARKWNRNREEKVSS
jgi:amino acid transporter